ALTSYDPAYGGWISEAGAFQLLLGRNAADIRRRARFTWTGAAARAARTDPNGHLHTGLLLTTLLADPEGKRVLERHLGELLKHPQAEMAMEMSLDQLAAIVPDLLPAQKLRAIQDDSAG